MSARKRRERSSEQSTRITDQVLFVYLAERLLDTTSTSLMSNIYLY